MKHFDITKFAKYCGLIKTTKRAGWLRYLPPEVVESVSDHSCRMGLLTLALCKHSEIDHRKCMEFAIIHDLAEGLTGDYTPFDKITKEEKQQQQLQAMKEIFSPLDNQTKQYLLDVWRRYQEQSELESMIVKDIDKYQMMQQALQYEQKHKVDLSEFFACAKNIKTQVIQEWTTQLLAKRAGSK